MNQNSTTNTTTTPASPTTLNVPSVCQFILTGGLTNDELGKISNAIALKRNQLDTAKMFQLNIGDKVVFNSKVRPTYLIGENATVLEVKRTRIRVKLYASIGRFSGQSVMVPPSLLDLVSA